MSSEHQCVVVAVGDVYPHPNADKLSLTRVFGAQVVIGKDQFASGDLAVYIPHDSLVDVRRPEFAFLAARVKDQSQPFRVRAMRLRGEPSSGVLLPLPVIPATTEGGGLREGDDLTEFLGVGVYEGPPPPASVQMGGDHAYNKVLWEIPKYDIESVGRFRRLLEETPSDALWVVTEKIHGANMRIAKWEGKIWVGSRNVWLKRDSTNVFWQVAEKFGVEGCLENILEEGVILYCELYGKNVQFLDYGKEDQSCVIIDAAKEAECALCHGTTLTWLNRNQIHELSHQTGIPMVPMLNVFKTRELLSVSPGIFEQQYPMSMLAHANGKRQITEGVVLTPWHPHTSPRGERVILKHVFQKYKEADAKDPSTWIP